MADFCAVNDLSLEDAVRSTWKRVKQRDWRTYPDSGEPAYNREKLVAREDLSANTRVHIGGDNKVYEGSHGQHLVAADNFIVGDSMFAWSDGYLHRMKEE